MGHACLWRGYKNDGLGGHWRAISDDQGRIMVAISFNADTGDAWEWADDASYPEKFSGLAMRMGVNLRGLCDDSLMATRPGLQQIRNRTLVDLSFFGHP